MGKIIFAILATLFVGCQGEVPMRGAQSSGDAAVDNVDPTLARVTVGAPTIAGVSGSSGLQVPTFQITLKDADYVEVVRCARSYKLTAPNGKTFEEIEGDSPTRRENLRYALAEAKGNQNACRILGTYVLRNPFQDLAANDGEYYYIVNPCVQKERSSVANVNCSYEIAVTAPIAVSGSVLGKEFVASAAELATAEAQLSATLQRMYRRSEELLFLKDICETNFIMDSASAQVVKALVGVASVGLQIVANTVFVGVGGMVASAVIGNLTQAFMSTPGPQYRCPKYDAVRKEGQEEFKLLEPQLKAVAEARAKMSAVNGEFKRLDEEILKSVRPN
jgi:hypothetical protein